MSLTLSFGKKKSLKLNLNFTTLFKFNFIFCSRHPVSRDSPYAPQLSHSTQIHYAFQNTNNPQPSAPYFRADSSHQADIPPKYHEAVVFLDK